MSTKGNHLIQITLMYCIIGFCGWMSLRLQPFNNPIINFLVADLVMTVVCFAFSLMKKNSSVYDAYWSVIPFFFILQWVADFNAFLQWQHWLIFAGVSFWSWRLTLNWVRSWEGFTHEDWRYVDLAESSGKWYPAVNFTGIHLFPTLIVFGCMWPLFYIFKNQPDTPFLFWIGIIFVFGGTILELVADHQLYRFRNRAHPTKGEVLKTGLWGIIRYPNYLGEMTFWMGAAITGLSYGAPYYTMSGIAALILMFLFASIPMKEKRMAERKSNYEAYRNNVPSLIPFTKFRG